MIDGAEFSTPNVDLSGGFDQVTKYWSTPGWHQSSSVFGVMINKAAWDALTPETQEKLKIAADATLLWSLANTEKRATEAYQKFQEGGTEIPRLDDATLATIQTMANETITEVACENPSSAKVYAAMLDKTSVRADEIEKGGKLAFVVGNEGHGISSEVRNRCDGSVIIPMRENGAESLNAAVAASVLMWEHKRI